MLPNSSNHKYYEKRVEAWVRMHRRRSSYTAVYSPIGYLFECDADFLALVAFSNFACQYFVFHEQNFLQFTTTTEVGLIAFVHNDDTSVFLAVYIEHGTLKFRLSCGNHQMTLVETKHNVTNGAPQSLYIRYHLCNFFKFSLVVVVNRHVNIELKTGLDAVIESIHW